MGTDSVRADPFFCRTGSTLKTSIKGRVFVTEDSGWTATLAGGAETLGAAAFVGVFNGRSRRTGSRTGSSSRATGGAVEGLLKGDILTNSNRARGGVDTGGAEGRAGVRLSVAAGLASVLGRRWVRAGVAAGLLGTLRAMLPGWYGMSVAMRGTNGFNVDFGTNFSTLMISIKEESPP